MATTKVSALAETTSPQANDELLINQSGVSKKVKITNLPAGLDNTKLPLAGGQMTGNITMSGSQTVDGRDVSADGTQLDTNTSAIATKAPIASPTFTGTVAIPNIGNLEAAVAANTAKTGITTSQANAITANTAKVGITTSQANAITANTAKVTNATHTGDVTGATELTIASGAVETGMIADDAVTAAKLANSINTEIAANTAKVTNATHTGDVTGATALTIANDAVTVAKLNLISTGSVPSLEAKGTSGVTDGYIQLNCAENSHGIKLKSPPHSAGASYTLTFPNDDGNANEVLTTNGSGVLTWSPVNRAIGVIAVAKATAIADGTDILGAIEVPLDCTITELRAKTATGTATVTFKNAGATIGAVSATTSGVSNTSLANTSMSVWDDLTIDVSSASGNGLYISLKVKES